MFNRKSGRKPTTPRCRNTFILEPIFTPSASPFGDLGDEVELDVGAIDTSVLAIDAITVGDLLQTEANPSGVFTVGDAGEVGVDFLYDGGFYSGGEVAIFSLEGMDEIELDSQEFIQEAARRALSHSELGHVVISDATEGAKFTGHMGEGNFNHGEYRPGEPMQMRSGDRFGFILAANQTMEEVYEGKTWGVRFSMATANPDDRLQFGQVVDVTGDGNTFAFEDLRLDQSDRDYNDFVIQLRGATGEAPLMDDLVAEGEDWRTDEVGLELIEYATGVIDDLAAESQARQTFVGIIDTGVAADNPDLDYDRIQLGSDFVDGDANPLLEGDAGNEHGTHIAGIIGATQDNGLGIDGINDDAPLWFGRAIGSGRWAESLTEFVDAAAESGQPNAVVNLSLDLTQVDANGEVTTRYEFTPQERRAIEYARQNGVLLVVSAGNDGDVMSVLGQASQEFDNIITVGAADGSERADYSSYGKGLDLLAQGGTEENPITSLVDDGIGTMAGTSVATAQVTGSVSRVWAVNPELSYRQVIEILKSTATDLATPGWDVETGAGLLNLAAAIQLAKATQGEVYDPVPWVTPDIWDGEGKVTAAERAAQGGTSIATAPTQPSANFTDYDRVDDTQPEKYYKFTVNESGYFEWTLTRQNAVTGFPTFPSVSIVNADGSSGEHKFIESQRSGISITGVVEGQRSTNGGKFLEPGTYYLKIKGGDLDVKDYSISTEWILDESLATTQFILSNGLNDPFVGSPATELNAAGQLAWTQNAADRRKMFGLEVKGSDQLLLNLSSDDGDVAVYIDKYIGSSNERQSIASYQLYSPGDREIKLNLNQGKYAIYTNYGISGDGSPKRFTLSGHLASLNQQQPTAPQPGEGKVPAGAGDFIKTVISNGVVFHYYTHGYLTIQPNGHEVWYAVGSGTPQVGGTTQPINQPEPFVDPDGNGSMGTARWFNNFGIDLGDGIKRPQTITLSGRSIGGTDLNDYHRFVLDDYHRVKLQLLGLNGKVGFELIRDTNGNGQIDQGEIIAHAMSQNGLTTSSRIRDLEAGQYYIRVFPEDPNAGTINYDLHFNAIPSDIDGNGSLATAQLLSGIGIFIDGVDSTMVAGSLGDEDVLDLWRFSLPDSRDVNLSLSNLQSKASLELIQDKNGNGHIDSEDVIAQVGAGISGVEISRYLSAGDYFVRVKSDDPSQSTHYNLTKTMQSLEGKLVKGEGAAIYLMKNGLLRHIPDPETFLLMGFAGQDRLGFTDAYVNSVPKGNPFPSRKDGALVKGSGHEVYYMENGKRRHIPDPETFKAMGLSEGAIQNIADSDLNSIPLGSPLPKISVKSYHSNIESALNIYFRNKSAWQGKSIEEMWDRVGGDSSQYGPYSSYHSEKEWNESMPNELIEVYKDLSTTILGSPRTVTSGYAYDTGYHYASNGRGGILGSHSGIDTGANIRERLNSATDGIVVFSKYYVHNNGVHNGQWIAVDETVDGKRTGRRWWYGHLDEDTIEVGQTVKAGEQIGITGNDQGLKHHLHLMVVDTYGNPPTSWNEVRNGTGGSYEQNVSDVLSRTVSPLHAYWKYRNGIKE